MHIIIADLHAIAGATALNFQMREQGTIAAT
jgi:hypothetical protein